MTGNKRIAAVSLVKAGVWLLLFVVLLGVNSHLVSTAFSLVPSAKEYKLESGRSGVTLSDVQAAAHSLDGEGYTAYVKQTAALSAQGGESMEVTLQATDNGYPQVFPLRFLYGGYFTASGQEETDSLAVIGEDAARRFFFGENPVGREVVLNGRRHTVVGVYAQEGSWLERLAGDGSPLVFVPFASPAVRPPQAQPSEAQEMPATVWDLPVNLAVSQEEPERALLQEAAMGAAFGGKLSAYRQENYQESRRVLAQGGRLALAFAGILLSLLLLQGGIRACRAGLKRFQAGRRSALVREERDRKTVILSLTGAAALLAAVLLAAFSVFAPYIPPQYLPADQIFDLSHYAGQFTQLVQTLNRPAAYYDVTGHTAFVGMLLQAAVLFLACVCFLLGFARMRRFLFRMETHWIKNW